jgi:hypothetical protein
MFLFATFSFQIEILSTNAVILSCILASSP